MIPISQHIVLMDDLHELMDLIRGHYEVVEHVEDKIYCDMRHEVGCINSNCMFFKFVPYGMFLGEDRCYFSRNTTSKAAKINYILLAKYKLRNHERIKELVKILGERIPKQVHRYIIRDKYYFSNIDIDINTKTISVVWQDSVLNTIKEDIHITNKKFRDTRMPFFEALKYMRITTQK